MLRSLQLLPTWKIVLSSEKKIVQSGGRTLGRSFMKRNKRVRPRTEPGRTWEYGKPSVTKFGSDYDCNPKRRMTVYTQNILRWLRTFQNDIKMFLGSSVYCVAVKECFLTDKTLSTPDQNVFTYAQCHMALSMLNIM